MRAGLKVRNFHPDSYRNARSQFVYSIFHVFPSIVKDELAVLQQRAAVQKTAETRITYDTLLPTVFFLLC